MGFTKWRNLPPRDSANCISAKRGYLLVSQNDQIPRSREVEECLEIGCGSGVLSAFSARMGWRVSTCDINPYAVATARNLANQLGLNISVYEGGLGPEDEQSFAQWSNNSNYDLIFWNLPYLKYDKISETLGPMEEAALLDTDNLGLFQRALYFIEKNSLIKNSGLCLFW